MPARPRGKRRVRLPVAWVLVAGFGGLMMIAVASVLALGVGSGTRNTISLLGDKANLALDNVILRLEHHLDPVAALSDSLASAIASGDLDMSDTDDMARSLRLALDSVQQITGILFIDTNFDTVRAGRIDGEILDAADNAADDRLVRQLFLEAQARQFPVWADPVWLPELSVSIISHHRPIYRDGTLVGVLAIAVSLSDLSTFLADLHSENALNAFVLYDERHIVAHRALADLHIDLSGRRGEPPLPRIDEIGDPVVAGLWDRSNTRERVVSGLGEFTLVEQQQDQHGPPDNIILMRQTPGYGGRPWTIGIVFAADEVSVEIQRVMWALAAGMAILLVSVALALLIGLRLSRRIRQFAGAAEAARRLDLDAVPDVPDSRFRELDNAASSFNAMINALRWFEAYVPKALVARLIRDNPQDVLISEERDLTVLFTDIRGFSTLTQYMSPSETAHLLNGHFSLLARQIEAEGGTVDKFIGDGLMAFWGAPEHQPDHAARAVRAAAAISRAMSEDNAMRAEQGLAPIQLRAALHTGPAVVGNIGPSNRLNYTVVGDTVNATARIESIASSFQGDDESCVLVSENTVREAAAEARFVPVGSHVLRGRSEAIVLHRLVPKDGDNHDPGKGGG
ncbi:MAG: adenylate/guanylate cyclase domain-containing protein [Inquilinaceae bacterium]